MKALNYQAEKVEAATAAISMLSYSEFDKIRWIFGCEKVFAGELYSHRCPRTNETRTEKWCLLKRNMACMIQMHIRHSPLNRSEAMVREICLSFHFYLHLAAFDILYHNNEQKTRDFSQIRSLARVQRYTIWEIHLPIKLKAELW